MVSESGGQIVSATSLTAMTLQLISLLASYYYSSVPREVARLPAGVWGAAFLSSITQSE